MRKKLNIARVVLSTFLSFSISACRKEYNISYNDSNHNVADLNVIDSNENTSDTDFAGTTIKADKNIQIGLRSRTRLEILEQKYKLGEIDFEENIKYTESDSEPFIIYWAKDNCLTDILKTFQSAIGSGQEYLNFITAGKYKAGWSEDIGNPNPAANTWNGFKKTPSAKQSEWEHGGLIGSEMKELFYLPLVFRTFSNESNNHIFLSNKEIYLTSFTIKDLDFCTKNSVNLADAVRCKVDYPAAADTSNNFIFDPNAPADYNQDVGGLLNLSLDRFYDSYGGKEIAYGEWEEDPIVYSNTKVQDDEGIHFDDCTTFYANHQVGIYPIDLTQSHPCTCETKSRESAVNSTHTAGKGITKTDTYINYGYVDFSIYLEGWNKNIDNYAEFTSAHRFAVELQFSVN